MSGADRTPDLPRRDSSWHMTDIAKVRVEFEAALAAAGRIVDPRDWDNPVGLSPREALDLYDDATERLYGVRNGMQTREYPGG